MTPPQASEATVKLTDRQLEVLRELSDLRGRPDQCSRAGDWATPLNFGGRNGSHHSATAKRLSELGLVDRKKMGRPDDSRGSCAYRITDAGVAALAALQAPTP